MKRIFIYTENACERRKLDAARMQEYLSKNDYKIVDNPEDSDIIILITCAAINESAEKSLNKTKEFQKYDADLIVAGCLPEIEKDRLDEIFNGKKIITKDLDSIDRFFPKNKINFVEIDDQNIFFENLNSSTISGVIKKIFKQVDWLDNLYFSIKDFVLKNLFGEDSVIYSVLTREPLYGIRISWGCSANCAYCAIRKAIGPFHSKPLDKCLKEFKKGLKIGYKKFVIIADDVGAYGVDINSSFAELLDKMTAEPGEYEILVRHLAPRWFTKYFDELEEIFKRRKVKHPYIPIQSGNERVLKLMNRFSDTKKIKDDLFRLKKSCPDLILSTSCIVGFPSETEAEFEETLRFIRKIDFDAGLIFPFSLRPTTEAENIDPKISEKEINRRLKYAKNFLKKEGYHIIHLSRPKLFFISKPGFFLFEKRYYDDKTKKASKKIKMTKNI